jgi:hypothetical protein
VPKPRTSAETGTATAFFPTESVARMPGLPRGSHDLTNEGLWSCRSTPPIADATRTYPQFIVARLHRVLRGTRNKGWRRKC